MCFVIALIMFAPMESPDESPKSHLAGVSKTMPWLQDLTPEEPLDTVKVYVTVQELG